MLAQAVMDVARGPLNDPNKRRYPDTLLQIYGQEGVNLVRRLRPDLYVGNSMGALTFDRTSATPLVLPDDYLQSLADYITARCQIHDTEAKAIEKATEMLTLYVKGLS